MQNKHTILAEIWEMKEVKYTKTHAKIQVGVSFHMRDIWKKFYLNFKSFV